MSLPAEEQVERTPEMLGGGTVIPTLEFTAPDCGLNHCIIGIRLFEPAQHLEVAGNILRLLAANSPYACSSVNAGGNCRFLAPGQDRG